MARKKFNKAAGKPVHTYVIEVQCSPLVGTPNAQGKHEYDPAWAEALQKNVLTWLDQHGLFEKKEAFRTELMDPASNGRPQFSVTCTSDCMQKLKRKFGDDIRRVTMAQRNANPSIYPDDKNCWKPTRPETPPPTPPSEPPKPQ